MTFPYPENVVRALTELSDREKQERLWLASEGEFSSFGEAANQLFTDTAISYDLERGKAVFGQPVDDMLLQLDKLLFRIDSTRDPEEIINDPKMVQVRELSAEIIRHIK